MTHQDELSSALASLNSEIIAAFDWLAATVDRRTPVTFAPNPGNIGDAAINLACFEYLAERFEAVEICAMTDTPRTECVFIAGGGNMVEPLYLDVRNFLDRMASGRRLFMFPATIKGYQETLRRIAPLARILCREPVSFAHVAAQLGPENVRLAHDAAFLLAPRLRDDFERRAAKTATAKCRLFRSDREGTHSEIGGIDIMLHHQSSWSDMALAKANVWMAARYLSGFGEVETDRLHCAILSAVLGRRTVLRANSYYKNAAVFEHSLSRLPNATFLPATSQTPPDVLRRADIVS